MALRKQINTGISRSTTELRGPLTVSLFRSDNVVSREHRPTPSLPSSAVSIITPRSLPFRLFPFHCNAMTENSGLSRRRVNTGPASSSPEPSSSLFASHAGSAFAGGNKIAFDPRDLERDEEESKTGGKIPRLTLMEEVLLLGLKDHQASPSTSFIQYSHKLQPGLLIVLE
jgi:hypothetical protein